MMSWHPRIKRLKSGYYEMSCGEERVRIWKHAGMWRVKGTWQMYLPQQTFRTKAEAVAVAHEWLAEYA